MCGWGGEGVGGGGGGGGHEVRPAAAQAGKGI